MFNAAGNKLYGSICHPQTVWVMYDSLVAAESYKNEVMFLFEGMWWAFS